ncbi:MAG: hypothetical protein FWG20_04540, partial [Candidatus Cloacimonetes bacterium]|nr:hypothetical protein [Candidatus Cloacimonadota bacterium]
MKRIIITLLIITCIGSLFAFDDLWEKARDMIAKGEDYNPGNFAMSFESISRKPAYEFRLGYEVIIAITPNEEGKAVASLVSKKTSDNYADLKDNKGIPRAEVIEMRKSVDELKAGITKLANDMVESQNESLGKEDLEDNDLVWLGIFKETNPKNLILSPQKKQVSMNGKTCQVYKVKYIPEGDKKKTENGTVYLDIETGCPVYSVFDLRSLKLPLELKLIKDPAMKTN